MNLFHVETGVIPAKTCPEESVPMLHCPECSSGQNNGSSKVFLVHDSLTCIANVTSGFRSECALTLPGLVEAGDCQQTDESAERKKPILQMVNNHSASKTKSRPPEYRCLSLRNLVDPAVSSAHELTCAEDFLETDNLLQRQLSDLGQKANPCQELFKDLPQKRKIAVSLSTSMVDKTDQFSIYPSPGQPENQVIPRKKTLGELAKEWHASQENEQKEDVIRENVAQSLL